MGKGGWCDYSWFQRSKVEPSGSVTDTKGNGTSCEVFCSILGPSVRAKAAAGAAALLLKLFPALFLAPMFIIIQPPRHLIICVIKLDTIICKIPQPPSINGQLKGKIDFKFIYS
jgi:hypothetical protein